MKYIKILILSIIITTLLIAAQFGITFYLKQNIYLFHLETYYKYTSFRYTLNMQNVVIMILIMTLLFTLYMHNHYKKTKVILTIILLSLFSFDAYHKQIIPTHLINKTENAIVIGKNNPIKMVYYGRFTCRDCVDLYEEISDEIKHYIDTHQLELTIKLVDANSLLVIENLNTLTYDTYAQFYTQSTAIKNITVDVYKEKLGQTEYERRIQMAQNNQQEAKALKIHWVPTFYINGKKYEGHYTKTQFKTIIEEVIKNGKSN